MDMYGHVWTCMNMYGHLWIFIYMYKHVLRFQLYSISVRTIMKSQIHISIVLKFILRYM